MRVLDEAAFAQSRAKLDPYAQKPHTIPNPSEPPPCPGSRSVRTASVCVSKLERAAAYVDKTLTDFVLDVALRQADSIVREHEVIALTPEEWQRFQDMLLSPAPPNERLRRALEDHGRIVKS